MVWDSERQRDEMFGGRLNDLSQAGDLWEYDGTTWTQRSPAGDANYPGAGGLPTGREQFALAYDDARRTLVLHGGIFADASAGRQYGETWELHANQWTMKNIDATLAADALTPVAGYHAAHGKVVMFAPPPHPGNGATWEWDGSTWTQLDLDSPSTRTLAGGTMAYDSARQRLAIYGGTFGLTFFDDEEDVVFFDAGDPTCGTPPVCGDGIVDAPEGCDDFGFSGCCVGCQPAAPGAPCSTEDARCDRQEHCVPTSCGNAFVDPGEACDDGNGFDGDCCTNTCTARDVGAACQASAGAASGFCAPSGQCLPTLCGDGVVEATEDCEPPGSECCTGTCTFAPVGTSCLGPPGAIGECDGAGNCFSASCGDGTIEPPEQCDDPANPCCSPLCQPNPDGGLCGNPCRRDTCQAGTCADGSADAKGCTAESSGIAAIDGSGGTLTTADGRVEVSFPLGTPAKTYAVAAGLATSEFGVGTPATRVLVFRVDPSTTFATPVTITVTWPDADDDGVVDAFGIDERLLRIYHDGIPLTPPCGSALGCDRALNRWTFTTTSFSEFVLGGTLCAASPKAEITLGKLLPPGGADTLAFKAVFPAAPGAALDPPGAGLELVVTSAAATIADVTVPGGAYSKATKTGWKVNKKSTRWSFAQPHGTTVTLARGKDGTLSLKMSTPGLALSPAASLRVTAVFGPDLCGAADYVAPTTGCVTESKGKTLDCKLPPPRSRLGRPS